MPAHIPKKYNERGLDGVYCITKRIHYVYAMIGLEGVVPFKCCTSFCGIFPADF